MFFPPHYYILQVVAYSGGADRIATYPIRISIQFFWIGSDRLSNPENLDRIGSDMQFSPHLSISTYCLFFTFSATQIKKKPQGNWGNFPFFQNFLKKTSVYNKSEIFLLYISSIPHSQYVDSKTTLKSLYFGPYDIVKCIFINIDV